MGEEVDEGAEKLVDVEKESSNFEKVIELLKTLPTNWSRRAAVVTVDTG